MSDLLTRLVAIEEAFEAKSPWCISALAGGVRHVQRNTDIMEDYREDAQGEDKNGALPGRYDGAPLAELRNLLPEIIVAISKAKPTT